MLLKFAQKSEQMRLLQQTLDEKRSELLRAEAKLRETEERCYASSVSLNDKVKDDLRVILCVNSHRLYHKAQSRVSRIFCSHIAAAQS